MRLYMHIQHTVPNILNNIRHIHYTTTETYITLNTCKIFVCINKRAPHRLYTHTQTHSLTDSRLEANEYLLYYEYFWKTYCGHIYDPFLAGTNCNCSQEVHKFETFLRRNHQPFICNQKYTFVLYWQGGQLLPDMRSCEGKCLCRGVEK